MITEEASRRKLEVIDLRIVCEDPRCYNQVSVIEPSEFGGDRIAEAILGPMLEPKAFCSQSKRSLGKKRISFLSSGAAACSSSLHEVQLFQSMMEYHL